MTKYNKIKFCVKCGEFVEVKRLRVWKNKGKVKVSFQCRNGHIFTEEK